MSLRKDGRPTFETDDFGGVYGIVFVDADEPVTFKIQEKDARPLGCLTIRPASPELETKRTEGRSFDITVTQPCRFSVEPDGSAPFLIFRPFARKQTKKRKTGEIVRAMFAFSNKRIRWRLSKRITAPGPS